jgi:hypothetical protein
MFDMGPREEVPGRNGGYITAFWSHLSRRYTAVVEAALIRTWSTPWMRQWRPANAIKVRNGA